MAAQTKPVDVLAVMDSCTDELEKQPGCYYTDAAKLQEARAAIAELIEACTERDLAQASYDGIPPGDARLSVSERWERLKAARQRYAAALANVGGAK